MPAPIRFLHLTDLHLRFHAPKEDKIAELLAERVHPLELVRLVLREARAYHPAFVLVTGDLVHEGGAAEYTALADLLHEELPMATAVFLPGNHDDRAAFCTCLLHESPCTSVNRVYDLDGLRIIALDSGTEGTITPEQTDWLKDMLHPHAPRGTLLALHHPLYQQNPMNPAVYPPAFSDVIARGGIDGIFCGHTHENWFGCFAGVPYVTADACSFMVEERNGQRFCVPCAGYVLAELGPQGLNVQMKRAAPDASIRFPI
ncbi:MAG: metallophosphoesterase [Ethanoligenens sp.]